MAKARAKDQSETDRCIARGSPDLGGEGLSVP